MKKPPDPLLSHPVSLPSCLCSQPNPFANLCAPSSAEGHCEFIENRSPQRRRSQASPFHHHRPCYLALWLNPNLSHSQPPCLNPLMTMPCTIEPIPKWSRPHDWLLQDVDFSPPEACEIQICTLGRNWYATVLLSIAVFLDSVPSQYQKWPKGFKSGVKQLKVEAAQTCDKFSRRSYNLGLIPCFCSWIQICFFELSHSAQLTGIHAAFSTVKLASAMAQ